MAEIYGPYHGVVDEVHDGDTVNVKLDLGFDITVYARVRVFGINAPELNTEAGKASRAYAMKLLPPLTNVRVTSHGWDKYGGRIDGEIFYGGGGLGGFKDFGWTMLESGHAARYKG